MRLSESDSALIATIYDPPRASRSWTLKDVLPDGVPRCFSLARWALVDALQACGVGSGDRVLLPELICREVLAAVHIVGGTLAFYPVSRELCPSCTADDMAEAKAIVAVNYFGFPQDLAVFRQYCRRTGAALIEDNALGLFSRDTNGELLGSRGDAGVFSFRKTIAVPDGGALVLTNSRAQEAGELSAVSGVRARYWAKQLLRPVVRSLGPVRASRAIGAVRQCRRLMTGRAVPVSAADAEMRIPVPPNPFVSIRQAISVAEPGAEIRRRRALYDLVGRIVVASGAVPVFPRLLPNVVPYGFPFLVSPSRAAGIAADVSRCGLQLAQWPELPTAVSPSAPRHYRDLMVLPFLW